MASACGHVNHTNLVQLKNITDSVEFKNIKISFCEACALEKQHKVHSKEPAIHKAILPEKRLYNDFFGGGNTLPGIGSYRYGSVVINNVTRTRFAIVLKTKNKICDKLFKVINRIETEIRRLVKALKTDKSKKYGYLQPYLDQKKIVREKLASYTQDQDSIAECSIRTILEQARAIMIHAKLPHLFWPKVISAAYYITNKLPTKALDGKTPYEAWHGHKPNFLNLQAYRCDAYVVDYHAKSKGKIAL